MLRNPVHFVCPTEKIWRELQGGEFPLMSTKRLTECSGGILNSWVVRTYYQLGLAGARVTTSPSPRRDSINIVSVRDFGRKDRPIDAFIVIPRGDAHDPKLADFVIEQNAQNPETSTRSSVPHWPQPGILPRDPSRGFRVDRVSFKGRTNNLDEGFRSQAFIDDLSKLGIQLELDTIDGLLGSHNWNDYRQCDAVIAVRNMRGNTASAKPASKLVNAWHANTIPMLGPEPAYRELKRSTLDYIEIYNPGDALRALKLLNANPALFEKIVENGRVRCQEFTDERITQRWIELLNGPVSDAFEHWKRKGLVEKLFGYVRMMREEQRSKQRYVDEIRSGPLLLDSAARHETLYDAPRHST
ncbi:MAG: glycosyltransferase [Labrys sp. (in: a-proteobacteria)]